MKIKSNLQKSIENHRGVIVVDADFYFDNLDNLVPVFSELGFVPGGKSEVNYMTNTIDIWGYSSYFYSVEHGRIVPRYELTLNTDKITGELVGFSLSSTEAPFKENIDVPIKSRTSASFTSN